MFEGLVAAALTKRLGRYIDGLDTKHVHLSIWDGKAVRRSLALTVHHHRSQVAK